jgi:hypothetical protein
MPAWPEYALKYAVRLGSDSSSAGLSVPSTAAPSGCDGHFLGVRHRAAQAAMEA